MKTRERGQSAVEYAVLLAVLLIVVIGTIHLVGSNASNIFSSTASALGN